MIEQNKALSSSLSKVSHGFIFNLWNFLTHPIWIITYFTCWLYIGKPLLFKQNGLHANLPLIMIIFVSTFVLPIAGISLLRLLGFVDSFQLKSRGERVGPFMVTIVLYLWMYITFYQNNNIPNPIKVALLSGIIGLFLAFFINLFSKISLHTLGLSSLAFLILLTSFKVGIFYWTFPIWGYSLSLHYSMCFSIIVIIAGLVGTGRLYQNAHRPDEVYGGYFIGAFSATVAHYFFS